MDVWVGILTFAAVLLLALGAEAARRSRAIRMAERVGAADRASRLEWQLDGGESVLVQLGRRLQGLARRVAPAGILADTGRRLRWAGIALQSEEFYAVRLAAAIVATGAMLALSAVGLGARGITVTLVAGATGYLGPDLWLTRRVRARQAAADRQLLGFVDMLAVAMEAGLNLADGIRQVADHIGGVLGLEFRRAADEVRLGAPRAAALAGVAERVGLDELSNVVAAIAEAERNGTPVAAVLRQQGDAIRQMRQLRTQELPQKTAVKILLPLMLCIFLPMMVVILGPALVNLAGALGM